MPTTLITGANRGIGLEFVRQYAAAGWRVHAACSHPERADALHALADRYPQQVTLHALDVADTAQIDRLAQQLQQQPIDLLLNNAGVYPDADHGTFGNTDTDAWMHAFRVNAMGPLLVCERFAANVARSRERKIALITSKMGSIADNGSGGYYLYRSSKTALNMVARSLAVDLAAQGIGIALLHPGWVKTDMGGPNALITAEQSVSGMRRVIEQLRPEDSGQFFAYDGQAIQW